MFRLIKTSPHSVPDNLFKTLSLYLVLTGLVLMLLAALSTGVWGKWSTLLLPRLSTQWLVWGAKGFGLGCMGLLIHDAVRFMKDLCRKYKLRKDGPR